MNSRILIGLVAAAATFMLVREGATRYLHEAALSTMSSELSAEIAAGDLTAASSSRHQRQNDEDADKYGLYAGVLAGVVVFGLLAAADTGYSPTVKNEQKAQNP